MTPAVARGRVLAAGLALLSCAAIACNPATSDGGGKAGSGGKGGSGGAGGSGGSGSGGSGGSTGGSGGDVAGSGGSSGTSGSGGSTGGTSGSGGSGTGGDTVDAAAPIDASDSVDGPAAGTPDAPSATSGAGCAGAKVCEDFESYAAGSAPGGPWKVGTLLLGTLTVDETKAHSGKRAMLVKGNGTGETELLLELGAPILPFPSNNIYGRAMIFMPKVPTTKAGHWDLIRATGSLPGEAEEVQYTIGTRDGHFLLDYEPHDCVHDSKQAFPENRWACISWQFDGSKGADGKPKDEMHVWLDGTEIQDAAVVHSGDACTYGGKTTEWTAPTFDKFHIGWNQYHPAVAFEMWVDDLAVDDKPIPCPP